MKNYLFYIIVVLLLPFKKGLAQKKHTLTFNTGNYAFFDVIGQSRMRFAQTGLQYEYHLTPKWSAFMGLSGTWKIWDAFSENFGGKEGRSYYELVTVRPFRHETTGKLLAHGRQTNLDFGIAYQLYTYHRHKLAAQVGASFSRVNDIYMTSFVQVPGYDDAVVWLEMKRAFYFGALADIQYNYALYKDRLHIGVYGRGRAYNKSFPFQLNYGLLVNYSF
jgi:hypothetical protein